VAFCFLVSYEGRRSSGQEIAKGRRCWKLFVVVVVVIVIVIIVIED
jgi:hypothetical protein